MKFTTIKDLYAWAIENHVEDKPIGIGFQDGGGSYGGDSFSDGMEYSVDKDVEVSASIEHYEDYDYVLLS